MTGNAVAWVHGVMECGSANILTGARPASASRPASGGPEAVARVSAGMPLRPAAGAARPYRNGASTLFQKVSGTQSSNEVITT